MKTIVALCASSACLMASQASAVPITLISEDFSGGSAAMAASTNPVWSDNDGSPKAFETYNSGGAGVRDMYTTYDHDNNPITPNITIPGGLEVNDDSSLMTLVASLPLPSIVTGDPGVLTFFAGKRTATGSAPTVSVFNVTDNSPILGTSNIDINADDNIWQFNSFNVNFAPTDIGDIIEVRWFGGGNGSGNGLQLADINFTANATAEPVVAAPSSLDVIRGKRQSNAGPLGYFVDAGGSQIGEGGSSTTSEREGLNQVVGFLLPTLNGKPESASLSITKTGHGDVVDADLYGIDLGFDPTTSGISLYFDGDADPNPNLSLLFDDYLRDDDANGTARFANVLDFLLNFYDDQGNPLQSEVFFRLNADVNFGLGGTLTRVFFDPSSVTLTLTGPAATAVAVPEPATVSLALLSLGGLMMRRRRLA